MAATRTIEDLAGEMRARGVSAEALGPVLEAGKRAATAAELDALGQRLEELGATLAAQAAELGHTRRKLRNARERLDQLERVTTTILEQLGELVELASSR